MDLGTRPTADEVKAVLGLDPHPTCGFVAETYRSPLKLRCPKPTRATALTARPTTSSSPPTPRSLCTGYAPTSCTTITWEIRRGIDALPRRHRHRDDPGFRP